jgi:MoaA/NifB/PqqE/SkfB family radical SAM enzyme
MGRIVLELTDRCNLRCQHCFEGRHGGRGELSLEVLERLLGQAAAGGFDEFALTGGEPTLHSRFPEVVARIAERGYRFGVVSNGWTFPRVYRLLLAQGECFLGMTFSMDGARAATHDGIRGVGSYRRLLQAMSVCVRHRIPFALNMVLTRRNVAELGELIELATALGARGVRFGRLIEIARSAGYGLSLTPAERDAADAEIRGLAARAVIPVAMAPGYRTRQLFPCEPLNDNEINVDWRGHVSLCCHLSGHVRGQVAAAGTGSISPGGTGSFAPLVRDLRTRVAGYRSDKQNRHARGELGPGDEYPCEYCLRHVAVTSSLGLDGGAAAPAGDSPGGTATGPGSMRPGERIARREPPPPGSAR